MREQEDREMLKLTFLVYAPQSMLLGDFKTLADWMTALIDHMEGIGINLCILTVKFFPAYYESRMSVLQYIDQMQRIFSFIEREI